MRFFAIFFGLLLSTSAFAADTANTQNRVGFSVTALTDVPNDTLVATLFSEATGKELAVLADKVNSDIRWAANLVKQTPEIKFTTQNYATQPVYRKGERSNLWRVRQTVRLESASADVMSAALGKIQERLGLNSLGYEVSSAASEAARERLVADVLKKFRLQASAIAKNLGFADYKIIRLNILDGGQPPAGPYPMMDMARMKSSVAPPILEPGEQTIDVTVTAEIEVTGEKP